MTMTAASKATAEGLYGNASTEDTASKSLTVTNESALSANGSCVQVAVRIRPMLPFEAGTTQCVEALSSSVATGALTVVRLGGAMGPAFTFDEVFSISSSQLDVFEHRVAPLVHNLLEGYNATILAYGQTGSGKTHTIMGPSLSNVADAVQDEVQAGVIPRAIRSIFDKLEATRKESLLNSKRVSIYNRNDDDYGDNDSPEDSSATSSTLFQYEVRVQFLEVYGEEIRDLLTPHKPTTKLTIRDVGMDEPEVLGATQNKVESAEEALLCLTRGLFRRVTGSTNMNESSSRSHAILSLVVEQSVVVNDDDADNDTTENGNRGNSVTPTAASKTSCNKTSKMHQHVQAKVSKFNFVDLAGAERQKRTGAEGKRLKEGIDINKGLLVLGNVISALGDPKKKGKAFVPYRESKLTRLLRGSLGGNHKTLMMACVSPSSSNMEESLNCLRYANRAKNIQNHAVVNVDATSRLIADLRGKVQILASDLLKVEQQRGGAGEGSSALETQTTFSIEVLKSLASGGDGYHHAGSHSPMSFPANFESSPSTVMTPSFLSPLQGGSPQGNEGQQQHGMSSPSLRGGRLLRRSVSGQERYDDNQHALSAENEALRLQLQAVTPGSSRKGETASHPSSARALEQAFVARATDYEREIAQLKARLVHSGGDGRLSNRSDHERTINNHDAYNRVDERPFLPNFPPRTPNRRGRSDSSTSSHTNRAESPELSRLRAQVFGSMSQSNNLDAEVEAEEKAFEALTRKFLNDDQSTVNKIVSITLCDDPHRNRVDHGIEPEKMFTGDDEQAMLEYGGRSHLQIEADLFELSNSIFAKEELIQQLQSSQEKYETMREFYEGKLRGMEELLHQKEAESEEVAEKLKKLGIGHIDHKELSENLRQRQEHIAELKRKQTELSRLTSVASHNERQLSKLRQEALDMKERKVSLQKQLTDDRKNHMIEVKKLKMESMQKDREMIKIRKVSDRKAFEAQKAQQMAKTRMEQMAQLKFKYKETEKRLRIQTVKHGVMEKAGLDPVMVGRREKSKVAKAPVSAASNPNKKDAISSNVNFDAIRDFFDQKVANVGRREALAEKIAQEWEEHLDLTMRRDELAKNDPEGAGDSQELNSIHSQIKYKEERIRQLAARLGKRQSEKSSDDSTSEREAFLFDKNFNAVIGRVPPMAATKSAAMVLFGMIVRERRRVASLARTASSLDEKVQEAETAAAAKDSAFRAYVDEQRHEVAMLTQNQQEQILSLMDMVRDETAGPSLSAKLNYDPRVGASVSPAEGHANPKLLVLANERVSVLERQLRDLQQGYDDVAQHKESEEEARELLQAKTKECENLEQEITCLQEALRDIREATSRHECDSQTARDFGRKFESSGEVLHIVANALHPGENSPMGKAKRHRLNGKSGSTFAHHVTPRRLAQGELTNSSDSEGVPDWAEDIMNDLAIIAEGKMPSSLRDIATPEDMEDRGGKSVFDRLTNPTAFTGVQKQKQTRANAQKKFRSSSTPPRSGQRQRKLISKQVADSLDMVVVPDVHDSYPKATPQRKVSQDRHSSRGDIDDTARRSVFDRLLSPSNLTGTQKQKYQDKRSKRTSDEGAGEEEKAPEEKSCQNDDSLRSIQVSNSSLTNVADDLLDELLSGNDDSGNNIAESSRPGKKRLEYNNQNVFERLQKTTTQACAVKQQPIAVEKTIGEKHQSGIAEKAFGELIDVNESYKEAHPKTETSERAEEYMHLDVFERLQKTTTQAYAEKQNKNIAEKMLGDILDSEDVIQEDPKPGPVSSGFERVDGYVQQNVFERLTKTITHSYAVKQNISVFDKTWDGILDSGKDQGKKMVSNSEHGSPGRGPMPVGSPPRVKVVGPPPEPKPIYAHQNVFERLQTTTTEAYAKKMNPPLEYHPQSSSVTINDGTGFHQSSMSSLPRNLDDP